MRRLTAAKVLRIGVGLLLTGLSTLTAFFVCQEVIIRALLMPKISERQDDLLRGVPGFLQDQKILTDAKLFALTSNRANAGPFLNSIIRWERASYPAARIPANAVLAEDVKERIDAWSEWPKGFEAWDRSGLNVQWMSQLNSFDHWDLEEGNLLAERFVKYYLAGKAEVWQYLQRRPAPLFSDFLYFAKVRVATALQDRNPIAGLRDIRQLAALAYSTERASGAMAAFSLLELEARAYEWMANARLLDYRAWRPVEKAVVDAGKRVVVRGPEYFGIFTPDIAFRFLFREVGMVFGRCHVIDEATLPISFYASHLRDPIFFERDYTFRLKALREIVINSEDSCRLRLVKGMWKQGLDAKLKVQPEFTWDWQGLHLASKRIPYVRNVAGITLALVGSRNLLNDLLE